MIIMDRPVEDDLERLLTTKYKSVVEHNINNDINNIIIDFQDFEEDVQEELRAEYMHYKYTDILDDVVTLLFNKHNRTMLDVLKDGPVVEEKIILFLKNVTPKRKIRDVTSDDIGSLMEIEGTVISVTAPFNFIVKAVFRCESCAEHVVARQTTSEFVKPQECPSCSSRRKFTLLETKSGWADYQEIIVQENPGEMASGVVPRTIRCRLIGKQLVDICKPGNVATIICTQIPIVSGKRGRGRVFDRIFDINYVQVESKESTTVVLEDEDIQQINSLAATGQVTEILLYSVFPSIYGRNDEKMGCLLALFGGVDEKKQDKPRRGTINVLMIGDPGIGKTTMLKGVRASAPKSQYASGRGASGVGLTAAVVNDPLAGWRLEAGAVVLADLGICCVDEIDKMTNEDRDRLREAMSEQTVTIHKATIHTTLNARTTILAAANPKGGKYDNMEYLTENIDIPIPILSRFDLIFIMRDIPDESEDEKIVDRVFETEEEKYDVISVDLIRKYVLRAKQINPTLSTEAIQKFKYYYLSLRKVASNVQNTPIAITVRQLEGLKRLGQAHARMRLSDVVTGEDAEIVIRLMDITLKSAGYDPKTGVMDIGAFEGKEMSKTNRKKLVEKILYDLDGPVHIDSLEDIVAEYGINGSELDRLLRELEKDAKIMSPNPGITFCHYQHVGKRQDL